MRTSCMLHAAQKKVSEILTETLEWPMRMAHGKLLSSRSRIVFLQLQLVATLAVPFLEYLDSFT